MDGATAAGAITETFVFLEYFVKDLADPRQRVIYPLEEVFKTPPNSSAASWLDALMRKVGTHTTLTIT
jgi:hypothetical protein